MELDKAAACFNSRFESWGISLPPDDIRDRRSGQIVHRGWAIWYLFGEDDRGEFLDYYSSHRMTDDDHIRIYFDGSMESLPVIEGMRICAEDPEEDERLAAEHVARNQAVEKLLEEKGFGLAGDEPGGVAVNRILRLQK